MVPPLTVGGRIKPSVGIHWERTAGNLYLVSLLDSSLCTFYLCGYNLCPFSVINHTCEYISFVFSSVSPSKGVIKCEGGLEDFPPTVIVLYLISHWFSQSFLVYFGLSMYQVMEIQKYL